MHNGLSDLPHQQLRTLLETDMNFLPLLTLLYAVVLALVSETTTASHETTVSVNGHGMHQQATNGIISTVAGNKEKAGFSGDGGAATAAELRGPLGIAIDSTGNYFIADSLSNVVRKVSASTGIITTVAGTGTKAFGGDGGPATSATFNFISAVALDADGNMYMSDLNNHRIRKVTAAPASSIPSPVQALLSTLPMACPQLQQRFPLQAM